MTPNEALIHQFYTAFQQKDVKTMQNSYGDQAIFNDAVFINLDAQQVRAMWQMLLSRSEDMKLSFGKVKEDGDKGGLDRNLRQYGNSIVINHNDNTRAGYWHLQYNGAVVNVGDTVKQGQLIGYSGKTGYSAFPHLHFIVWRSEAGGWRQIGTRFQTKNGAKYLRPYRSYRRPNEQH